GGGHAECAGTGPDEHRAPGDRSLLRAGVGVDGSFCHGSASPSQPELARACDTQAVSPPPVSSRGPSGSFSRTVSVAIPPLLVPCLLSAPPPVVRRAVLTGCAAPAPPVGRSRGSAPAAGGRR